jgi:hypothetical protein
MNCGVCTLAVRWYRLVASVWAALAVANYDGSADIVLSLNDTLVETRADVTALEAKAGKQIAVQIQHNYARSFVEMNSRTWAALGERENRVAPQRRKTDAGPMVSRAFRGGLWRLTAASAGHCGGERIGLGGDNYLGRSLTIVLAGGEESEAA